MVGSINDLLQRTLLPSQNNATNVGNRLESLKTNKKATEAIIQQLSQATEQSKALMTRSAQATKIATASPDANLPRGSLVDMVV
ncbi:MAG: hypothetical protein RBT70_10100 [Alphaproteobacteria bacterium]|jgi:hypothetical protein|nr:hypothetical protein [Alphaproteobacteria bacterium]